MLIARRDFALLGDDFFYHWQANALADGKGFLNPFTWKALGRIEPSAAHPPLYSMYLGVFSWLGFTSALAHRLASCLLGAAAVVVVGLVGRKIAGDRAGLIGAGIAAVYPQLWINDGMLVSESMYILMIAVTLLFAYRLWESRSLARRGLARGHDRAERDDPSRGGVPRPAVRDPVPVHPEPRDVEALPHRAGDGWGVPGRDHAVVGPQPDGVREAHLPRDRQRHRLPGVELRRHVLRSVPRATGTSSASPATRRRRPKSSARSSRGTGVPGLAYLHARDPRDDSELDTEAREKAFEYIGDHLDRVPIVVAARVGRIWGVFRPSQEVNFDIFFERRGKWSSWTGAYMYYALVPFAVYALVVMRKRRVPISPMIAMFALVTFTVAMAMGITRYRVGADVALAILGGVAIDALIRRFRRTPAGSLAADDGLQPA